MSNDVHVSESAGAYVLGALAPEEAQQVEAHAASCSQCRKEIAELKQVVSVLPLAASSVEPSTDLKARILAASKGEDQADAILRRTVVTSVQHEPKRDFWHRPIPSWAGVAGWLGLAAACVVAGIFIGVTGEHNRMLAFVARSSSSVYPAADNAFQFHLRSKNSGRGFRRRCAYPSCTFIHRGVSQAVSFLIVLSQRMADGKPIQLRDQLLSAAMEFLQRGILYLVNALDLAHQQFGVTDYFESPVSVFERVLQRSNQSLILGEVVGLMSKIFTKRGQLLS